MGGSSSRVTIGYKYHLGMHMVLCHGPIDHICRIEVDGRIAWEGEDTGGTITVDAPKLFGGDKREGGVSGLVDIDMGDAAQTANTYLESQLGADTPAFRGVVSAVLNQCYMGNNPYLKAWAFCAQRIHVTTDGAEQWYDEKAAIGEPNDWAVYDQLTEWFAPGGGGASSGQWDAVSTTLPAYDADLGTDWNGTDPFPYTVAYDMPIGGTATFTGTADLPGGRIGDGFLKVIIYHDDFVEDGAGLSFNGSAPLSKEKDDYYHTTYYVKIPQDAASLSFEYSVIQGVPSGTTSGFGGGYSLSLLSPEEAQITEEYESIGNCADMNPAHIIRECLSDPDWGMGYLAADIDDTAFTAAADALYSEAMGISLLWDRQMPLEDFIAEILRHIDGVLYVDRVTGKFVLNLIRNDYTIGDLVVLDESNVSEVSDARRPTVGELTNSLTVNFHDKYTGETASVGVQDQALIQIQGATVGTTVQYPGFTRHNTASRAAQRDLKSLSIPLLSAELVASREATDLNVGDPFVFTWPDMSVDTVVMRVQSISVGDGRDNSIKISCVEDVFGLAGTGGAIITTPETGLWSDPADGTPEAALPRLVEESPYYPIVQRLGQLATDTLLTDDSDAGFLMVAAGRQAGEINANLHTDSGAGYIETDTLDFSPYAALTTAVAKGDTKIYIDTGEDLEEVAAGDVAQINDELFRVDGFGTDGGGDYVTVGRGVLDTVPAIHAIASSVLFWDGYIASDGVQYTASDSIDVKLTTVSGSNELDLASAPEDTVTMDSRAIKPYPPGNVKVNTEYFPEAIVGEMGLTWAHRDRTQQTSGTLYDFEDVSIGPETTTTYTLRIYGESDTLLRTETGLTGTAYDYDLADEASDSLISGGVTVYQYIFDAGGSFTLSADTVLTMLVVGGGGAGATWGAGGGGGGGAVILTRELAAGTYTVTTGAGAVSTGTQSDGAAGNDSSIDTFIEATGGGGGYKGATGGPGGHSGVGKIDSVIVNPSFADGGTNSGSVGGGGGGSGEAGSIPDGGDGLYFTVFDEYYGGGGGGASSGDSFGGLGGGGDGHDTDPTAGVDGQGGGGGGSWSGTADPGTAGGDGVVIVVSDVADMTTTGSPSVLPLVGFRPNGSLRFELESVVGSYTSMQKHDISLDRAGYGFQYGNYYGGLS